MSAQVEEKEVFWYECRVKENAPEAVKSHLGRGYTGGQRCWSRQHWDRKSWAEENPECTTEDYPIDHEVFVFNGTHAIRDMSKENARSCLVLVRRLIRKEHNQVESRFSFEVNR